MVQLPYLCCRAYVPVGADFLMDRGYIHNFNGWKWIWHTGGGGSEEIQIRLLLAEWGAILAVAGLLVLANENQVIKTYAHG